MTTHEHDNGRGSRSRAFPDRFLWGAATSAYQTEGAVAADGRGLSVWDTFSHTPGKIRGGDTGDVACDFYHRLSGDLDLIQNLGLNAFRFSVSWPRVQPDGRGSLNQPGVDFYRRLIHGLRDRSVTPAVTLHHWDLPQALEDRGGWTKRDTAERFADYAQIMAEALGDAGGLWITMNEPQQVANQGYRTGTHAPGRRDDAAASAATHHLLLAHGLALPRLRATLPAGTPVGLSLDFHPIRTIGAEMEEIVRVVDAEENRIFLDPILHGHYPHAARARFLPPRSLIQDGDLELISAPLDFLGVNYYTPRYIKRALEDNESENGPRHNSPVRVEDGTPGQDPRTTMGWAIVPEAFYDLLRELGTEAPRLALYVTENGCAAEDYVDPQGEVNDFERIAYLRSHLEAAARAIADGVDLRGYFVWSLLDNFEWAWGYQKRFGLVFVDFSTQRRVPKRSSRFYAELARTGVIPAAPHASLTRPQAPHADLVDTSRETGLRSVPKT